MGKYKFIEERVETMSSSELKIFLNILKSRSKELMSTLESVRGIKDLEAVCKSTQKLNNRVSEFDGGSFLILVVGPVKSGKSTLALNPQLHSRSATYIKRNGLLIRKTAIKSSHPFQYAYHPLTP